MATAESPPTTMQARKARLNELLDYADKLGAELDTINGEMKQIEDLLKEDMAEAGEQNYRLENRTFFLKRELVVSKGKGISTEQVCSALNEAGFGDLVSRDPNYNAASLKARVKELLEHGGLPEPLAPLLYVDQPVRLRHRKAS